MGARWSRLALDTSPDLQPQSPVWGMGPRPLQGLEDYASVMLPGVLVNSRG